MRKYAIDCRQLKEIISEALKLKNGYSMCKDEFCALKVYS